MTHHTVTDRIGFLHEGGAFKCIACTDDAFNTGQILGRLTPVFVENIRPYSQVCHECGKLVVDGAKKSTDGTPLCVFDPPEKQPDEMTQAEIDRQDYVDNAIYNLVNDLVPAPYAFENPRKAIEWDMSWIADLRERIEVVINDYLGIPDSKVDDFSMAFYPYREIKFGPGPDESSDELFEPTDDPAWEDKR